jgi:hypothetical protein
MAHGDVDFALSRTFDAFIDFGGERRLRDSELDRSRARQKRVLIAKLVIPVPYHLTVRASGCFVAARLGADSWRRPPAFTSAGSVTYVSSGRKPSRGGMLMRCRTLIASPGG